MKYVLEVIAFNPASCAAAQQAGTNRIELCANPGEGGTTPSYGLIKAAREILHIALFPIIRPRGGDFLYSTEEYDVMTEDVRVCKDLGCDGIVVGMLREDATIDLRLCSALVNLAYPMSVTFHRAFDRVADPEKALEDLIDCGCERVLTSGFHPTAEAGAENIKKLIKLADNRIIIMPGSGVRADNIARLAHETGAQEFHSSARTETPSAMKVLNPFMKESPVTINVDPAGIEKMVAILNGLHS